MLRMPYFVIVAAMIVTVAGRAATLSSGSTIQTEGPPGDEKNLTTEFVGTKLEVVPQLVANNRICIEYRLDYSSLGENADSKQPSFPKISHTMVETTFETSPGETFISGRLRSKVHAGDLPEHLEIVFLVTPELISRQPK
jgi:Flp pilus assembly secretin CpaC